MAELESLDEICGLLTQKYGTPGTRAAEQMRLWMSGTIPFAYPETIQKHLRRDQISLLFDAFWQILPFGTGGRRGKVGYGPNRMNPSTLSMTVQGHCDYINRTFGNRTELCVVVANDVRIFRDIAGAYPFVGEQHPLLGVSSRSLARLACEVYAGNGITAFMASPDSESAVLTTPELSFAIAELKAVGGVNVSASHNPPDDNGIKVYDEWGSQPVAPQDQLLIESMSEATNIRRLAFDEACSQGLVKALPVDIHSGYVRTYVSLYGSIHEPRKDMPIVYTPLCGCGLTTVGDVLTRLGFPFLVPPDQYPDGLFSSIPFRAPNPEIPQALVPAMNFADQQGAGLVLSSDPDADRVGVEVKLNDGTWFHCDGNQIAAILCYFLMLDPKGPQRSGLVIETLVTTRMLGEIVKRVTARGLESWCIDDLLVGFKYVADVLKTLDIHGEYKGVRCSSGQLVLAAEESHGVVMIPSIRDKDATPACMYLAVLYQRLRSEGKTLVDYYTGILEEMGGFDTLGRSITMNGAAGVLRRDELMASLRNDPPLSIGGYGVKRALDYWSEGGPFKSESEKLPRNVIQFETEAAVVTVRPSGTEPKLKFYCELLPSGSRITTRGRRLLADLRSQNDVISREFYRDLLGRVGLSLGDAALMLPDIVDLDEKLEFERETIPRLRDALTNQTYSSLEALLGWIRSVTTGMTPGADPLPALRMPLTFICNQLAQEAGELPLLGEIRAWAAGGDRMLEV